MLLRLSSICPSQSNISISSAPNQFVEDEINGMSSSLVQQKKDLEAEKAKNALERKINLRPSKEALAQKNILKGK